MKKVVLCGYMGCGKSTVGHILSAKIDLPSFDLDDLVEKKAGLSVSEIFSKKGEIYFRRLEHEVYMEMMSGKESFVLALGGGTPAYANNHLLLKGNNVQSFFLKASIDTLYDRLIHEKHGRPLLAEKSEEEMKEHIAKHLFDRNYYYNQANKVISVDGKSADEVASEILEKLA
ncbi:shikimate kinase [Flavobacterium sp.]|uniref:shikimate kinase n=1 Tax=Flavobacterium sp. TaxID=239 RepID=UPI00122BA8C6|nr:shikimate kinase [Flavobacterium sp.]RZJ71711.1 MAG: shikimate kinase [Flavobacterium sp.]